MSSVLKRFMAMESASGILLILAALAAILMANSGWAHLYTTFLDTRVQVRISALDLDKPLLLWVNDGLMALFFLLIGLEVKRELVEGALSRREQAIFPALAALGGMVFPALWFLLFNADDPLTQNGWAIPAATDIAFALGVMALLGKRVPLSLKVFLLALAIIDDLGVILIIALFYSHGLSLPPLGIALLAIVGLLLLNRSRVGSLAPYLLLGLVVWVAVLKSGIHATLAGVLLGFLVPLYHAGGSPSKRLEHALHPWCAFLILPLFAFANAGVSLQGLSLGDLSSALPLGVMMGLLVGKPMGVFLISWLAVKLRIAQLPADVCFRQIFAVSVLCGIGFTMSIFITSLAFVGHADLANLSRLGILLGSTLAALIGYTMLHLALPRAQPAMAGESVRA
ncbi:Na+/H+ antiporter NhaA [Zobellella denitrificans]|jgi:NhaA family Na+:H+ antiporter|uniref:Na(+)/H(+) antiporter NhaA n=1 Tax=Zobellella denitrificans TaxID=347534 RepID=A0A231N059_9GAMM|nr:Na+/H+ antiporter NhaA [Zobellella denitrificans]ATG72874.1 sodium:proton antiporter [Zobellella denitrificans]OXS15863.1 Na+/H+ antiporter NhaA [Zobellella denitrificans]